MPIGPPICGLWLRPLTACCSSASIPPIFVRVNPDAKLDVKRKGLNVAVNNSGVASSSRGLVGDTVFAVLPNIQPIHTFTTTLAWQSVR